ncbi:PEPxxWA-CTERM sorting domain-containing protein [Sphingomonas sp. SORGH_AS_0438]|uniref:PEPxxWA-CTERM sorting domain-containing protein n=1 Tax=Sphingomonas sp. SORGH_AS_0438 TaxID=3041756 RepID=UPI00285F41BC|nr:PEPxxWA-CTERM sorting domain-containing protein [Sphingomonas sp. SORGH_AS_0438]MDR6125346.1 hypothetical protein [Sphingomonas sp. SORGH_AS_0438]
MRNIVAAVAYSLLTVAAVPASASTIVFQNDFSSGLSDQESVTGRFFASDGYVGHHGAYYTNSEISSYSINSINELHGAVLNFDLDYRGESGYDFLTILKDGVQVSRWSGFIGPVTINLGGVGSGSKITFRFTSDGSVVNTGVKIDNVRIVADSVSAVPEPATWMLMLGGFGMVGATMRYRRRSIAVVTA